GCGGREEGEGALHVRAINLGIVQGEGTDYFFRCSPGDGNFVARNLSHVSTFFLLQKNNSVVAASRS
ncbi:MAG TPA: hypothetical protein VLQ65_14870, partial [Saliniramus sp.]|nr:hypothetical protein [Saliniramus sp.]